MSLHSRWTHLQKLTLNGLNKTDGTNFLFNYLSSVSKQLTHATHRQHQSLKACARAATAAYGYLHQWLYVAPTDRRMMKKYIETSIQKVDEKASFNTHWTGGTRKTYRLMNRHSSSSWLHRLLHHSIFFGIQLDGERKWSIISSQPTVQEKLSHKRINVCVWFDTTITFRN